MWNRLTSWMWVWMLVIICATLMATPPLNAAYPTPKKPLKTVQRSQNSNMMGATEAIQQIDGFRRLLWKRNYPNIDDFHGQLVQHGFQTDNSGTWPGFKIMNTWQYAQGEWLPAYDDYQARHEKVLTDYVDKLMHSGVSGKAPTVKKSDMAYYENGMKRFQQIEQDMLALMGQQQRVMLDMADRYRRIDLGGLSNAQYAQIDRDIQNMTRYSQGISQRIVEASKKNAFEDKAPCTKVRNRNIPQLELLPELLPPAGQR